MPITLNLYREDEVIAALRLAIARGRATEAAFWVQEGLESDMDVAILQTLLMSWMYTVGVGHLDWLGWFLQGLQEGTAFTEETIIALTVALVNAVKAQADTTVFALLAIGMEKLEKTPEDRVTFTFMPPHLRNKNFTKHEIALIRAIIQGKFVYAWKLARPLWATGRAGEILEMMGCPEFPVKTLGPLYCEKFIWPFRALALIIAQNPAVLHTEFGPHPLPDRTILADWSERKKATMLLRRAYSVPPECLYSYTARGSVKMNQTTDNELTDHLEETMESSIFWNEYAEKYTTGGGVEKEGFYEKFFPNDRPDEWPRTERAKSHGFGATPVGEHDEAVILKRCLHRFYRYPSKGIWGGLDRAIEVLVSKGKNENCFEEYYSSADDGANIISTWDMGAVKKALEEIC